MPPRGTTWPRLAGALLKTGHTREARRNSISAFPASSQRTDAAPAARTTGAVPANKTSSSPLSSIPPTIGGPHEEPNVDPDSLRNTLEAHREANRASLIVKIAGKGSLRQPIQIPSLLRRVEQLPKSQHEAGVRYARLPGRHSSRRAKRRHVMPMTGGEFLAQWAPDVQLRCNEQFPWMQHMKPQVQTEPEGRLAATEQLNREIDAFYTYSQPTSREKKAAEQALQEVIAAIKKGDESIKVDVVGSRATGLALPMSDIDLNVSNSPSSSNTVVAQSLLRKVAMFLSTASRYILPFRALRTRIQTKIPLLTGRHMSTNLEFQIQSTVDVFLSMQQTLSFINEFPTLPKLFILLKQMLTMRGLNVGDRQGLTSYPLLVMIVAALKFSEGKIGRRDAGAQLLFFLDMYSDINFTTTAISFSPLQYIVKRHPHSSTLPHVHSAAPAPDSVPANGNTTDLDVEDVDARRRFATIKPDAEFLMCLQDPANLQNDLGKSAYRIKDIQNTFIRVREGTKTGLQVWNDAEATEQQKPLLASCVGGDYHIYEHIRHDLGASVGRVKNDFSKGQ